MEIVKFVRIIVMMMVGCLALSTLAMAKLHKVGGGRGWTQNLNYTEWAAKQHIYVGDWLCKQIINPFPFSPHLFTSLYYICIFFTIADISRMLFIYCFFSWKRTISMTVTIGTFHFDELIWWWLWFAVFNFDKRDYNILEVNETSYEACNDGEFIQNITHGGRDVIQLTETRHYYFLSAGGYCYHGMKLDVLVEAQPAQPAAPPPSKNDTCS